jgi:hypothetical protein
MPEQIIGVDAFTEQPEQRDWKPDEGWIITRTWHGPQDKADAYAQTIADTLDPDTIHVEKGVYAVISATFSTTASAPDEGDEEENAKESAIWELDGVRLDKDLRTHPAFNGSSGSDTELESAEVAVRRGTGMTAIATFSEGAGLYIQTYVRLRNMGVNGYLAYYWVIRRTMTTARADDVKASMENIFYVFDYTTNGDGATNRPGIEDFPHTDFQRVKWSQPFVTFWDGNAATVEPVTQWLKMPPQVRNVSTKWVQIVNEWWGTVGYDGGRGNTGGWQKRLYEGGQAVV